MLDGTMTGCRGWVLRTLRPVGGALLILVLWSSLAVATETAEFLLAQGTKLYIYGHYGQAKETLLRGIEEDPHHPEIWSLLGVTHFALEEFEAARDALSRAVALNPRVPHGKLYLGASWYRLGNLREARHWLQQARADTPDEALVHYYLGLVAYGQQRLEEADQELATGVKLAPGFALGFEPYQQALAARKTTAPPKPFDLNFATGIEYDDNVKVLPDKSNINPGFLQGQGKKADWRVPLLLRTEYRPLMRNNLTLGLQYFVYGGFNTTLTAYNVFDQLAQAYLEYRWNRLSLRPFYAFDYTLLGGKRFSNYHNAGLWLRFQETSHLLGEAVYLYQKRDFRYPVFSPYARDGDYQTVGVYQALFWDPVMTRLGFLYERQPAQGRNFRGNRYRFPVEFMVRLPYQVTAYTYFEYARFAADTRDSFYRQLRRNDYFEVDVQLRRPLTAWLDVILGYSHISDTSNMADYRYNRNIYQVLLNLRY